MYMFPASGVVMLGFALLIVTWHSYIAVAPFPPAPIGSPALVTAMAPASRVTVASMLLYYIFLFVQTSTAFFTNTKAKEAAAARGDKAPSFRSIKYSNATNSGAVLRADRTVGNYLEQLPPFLVSLWLYAFYVSAPGAESVGYAWLAARALYPFVFSKGVPYLFLSTFPAYGFIWYMLFKVFTATLTL